MIKGYWFSKSQPFPSRYQYLGIYHYILLILFLVYNRYFDYFFSNMTPNPLIVFLFVIIILQTITVFTTYSLKSTI